MRGFHTALVALVALALCAGGAADTNPTLTRGARNIGTASAHSSLNTTATARPRAQEAQEEPIARSRTPADDVPRDGSSVTDDVTVGRSINSRVEGDQPLPQCDPTACCIKTNCEPEYDKCIQAIYGRCPAKRTSTPLECLLDFKCCALRCAECDPSGCECVAAPGACSVSEDCCDGNCCDGNCCAAGEDSCCDNVCSSTDCCVAAPGACSVSEDCCDGNCCDGNCCAAGEDSCCDNVCTSGECPCSPLCEYSQTCCNGEKCIDDGECCVDEDCDGGDDKCCEFNNECYDPAEEGGCGCAPMVDTCFARDYDSEQRCCFIDGEDGTSGTDCGATSTTFGRWGWTNGPYDLSSAGPRPYGWSPSDPDPLFKQQLTFYCGAGQCDISKGFDLAHKVHVKSNGIKVRVKWSGGANSPWELHLGCGVANTDPTKPEFPGVYAFNPGPEKYTVAPGKYAYPVSSGITVKVVNDSILASCPDLWVIVHTCGME